MRQRFLLVAGWVVAAVVTSLVATGAVAVAGGQVTDRPLRPLTAAEVAALPIVGTTDEPVPASPLPPADSQPERSPSVVGTPDGGPGSIDEPDPAGNEGTLPPDPGTTVPPTTDPPPAPPDPGDGTDDPAPAIGDPPESDEPPDDTPNERPKDEPQKAVAHLEGGTVSVVARSAVDIQFRARPRPGFVVTHEFADGGGLIVLFAGERLRSKLVVEWVDGELVLTLSEERV